MPMGAKCSQDAFQIKMDEILEGLNGIIAIHDDITIFGKTEEEHDRNLIAFMDRAAKKLQEMSHQTEVCIFLRIHVQ